jgi:hypothetical protein
MRLLQYESVILDGKSEADKKSRTLSGVFGVSIELWKAENVRQPEILILILRIHP